MKVEMNDGRIYDVRWKRLRRSKKGKDLIDTVCIVSSIDNSKTGANKYLCVSTATTCQSLKDKYIKSVGRKISLDRALRREKLGVTAFPKIDREIFWGIYKEECNLI